MDEPAENATPQTADAAPANATPQDAAAQGAANNEPQPADQNPGQSTEAGILKNDPEQLPISDWSKVDLGLDESTPVDAELLASFGEEAIKLGLTPTQARGAVQWQIAAMKAAYGRHQEAQYNELKKAWGNQFQANKERVINMITTIDRKVGDEAFSRALAACGALDNAQAVQGMLVLAGMIAEDSTGSGTQKDTGPSTETAEQGIEAMYKAVRAGRG